MNAEARSVTETIERLAAAQASFAADYNRMIDAVLDGRATAVCTIYDANYPPPLSTVIVVALALFYDVITRASFIRGLPCSELANYADPIEPSEAGGAKIAAWLPRCSKVRERQAA